MRYRFVILTVLFASLTLLTAGRLNAENWILVEAMVFPEGCANLTDCVAAQTHEQRTLMAMDSETTSAFLDTLDALADVRGVPEPEKGPLPADFDLVEIVPNLRVLEIASKPDVLRGIPGIYFDATRVAGEGASDRFIAEFAAKLTTAGVRILTEDEALALPGAAKMSVSLSESRENAGCVFPFRASLTLKEEVVLVRDPKIKFETTSWTYSVGQNFTAVNYLGYDALTDAAQRFIDDYTTANAS